MRPFSYSDATADLLERLKRLSKNLWWTWNQDCQDIFQELSPRGWRELYHNAVAVLNDISEYELHMRFQDPVFAQRVKGMLEDFDAHMKQENTWAAQNAGAFAEHPVAYFTAEYGFHETLPIAAGGLGILSGDHARSASDLGLGFVGISLFYREGYFQQAIDRENWQKEYYTPLNPDALPLEPVLNKEGRRLVGQVEINLSQVYFQVWKVNIGRCCIYLLDANREENEPFYRDLTLRVYGGDNSTRIMQEVLLGIGGVRLLRTLGIDPAVYHMNEGHVAFVALELIREEIARGCSLDEALARTRRKCVFTTHTPVDAGHDRFSPDLVYYALQRTQQQMGLSFSDFMALGRVDPKNETEPFCMTVLALKASRAANAVSALHGQVSRRMWQPLYPGKSIEDVPIGHITNGIHLLGWMKGPVRQFWRNKLGADWETDIHTPEFWERMLDPDFVTDEEIWALRYRLRRELIEFARHRSVYKRLPPGDAGTYEHLLNPDALTIGFARRFATYKRAPLLFADLDAIVRMATDPYRPVQFIFSGKAHPADNEGKRCIQKIIHLSKYSELKDRLLFIENYDINIARQMISGCDIWLNTPRRPLEASGTSGQKIVCNGGLNLSIMDGWWREGYDGTNGFAIGEDLQPSSVAEQDRLDNENLCRVLSEEVIPSFYERDKRGIPRRWIATIRRSMATLLPKYTTWRMVQEYVRDYYIADSTVFEEDRSPADRQSV
ncbi:MAG TPA: alpha-glucan family phosphorylase [Acidobacteriota bacterium]|nr:alpha-glucan family phosphorylase [Acidobacteriota bacterium]